MRKKALIFVTLLCFILIDTEFSTSKEEMHFPDEHLENTIRMEIGKSEDAPIYKEDLRRIWKLDLSNAHIENIEGLEHCINLYYLLLDNNAITDISPLAHLTHLVELSLEGNEIIDISSLASLTTVEFLYLGGNNISDISPLSGMTNLSVLSLSHNNISDISPLFSLATLTELYLDNNSITDIFSLSSLENLTILDMSNNNIQSIIPLFNLKDLRVLDLQRNEIRSISEIRELEKIGECEEEWIGAELDLSHNEISDITPLIKNPGVNEGDTVDISNNPLNSKSIELYIPRLEKRGVELTWKPIKEISTPVQGSELYIGVLAVIISSVLIFYIYIRRKKPEEKLKEDKVYREKEIEFSELKILLKERNRLNTLLNELKSRREELISGRISEEKYKKMYDHVSKRLETIEDLIEEKRKKIVNYDQDKNIEQE